MISLIIEYFKNYRVGDYVALAIAVGVIGAMIGPPIYEKARAAYRECPTFCEIMAALGAVFILLPLIMWDLFVWIRKEEFLKDIINFYNNQPESTQWLLLGVLALLIGVPIAWVLLVWLFSTCVGFARAIVNTGEEWGPSGLILYLLLWVFLFPLMLGLTFFFGILIALFESRSFGKYIDFINKRAEARRPEELERLKKELLTH